MGALLGAALNAGASVIQNGLNWFGNTMQNRQAMRNWERMNEYNSPKNQMKRFQEAGLNPHLIYGQGTAGNASSAPSQTAPPPVDISAFGNMIKTYLELKSMDKDIEAKTTANKSSLHDFIVKAEDYGLGSGMDENFKYDSPYLRRKQLEESKAKQDLALGTTNIGLNNAKKLELDKRLNMMDTEHMILKAKQSIEEFNKRKNLRWEEMDIEAKRDWKLAGIHEKDPDSTKLIKWMIYHSLGTKDASKIRNEAITMFRDLFSGMRKN